MRGRLSCLYGYSIHSVSIRSGGYIWFRKCKTSSPSGSTSYPLSVSSQSTSIISIYVTQPVYVPQTRQPLVWAVFPYLISGAIHLYSADISRHQATRCIGWKPPWVQHCRRPGAMRLCSSPSPFCAITEPLYNVHTKVDNTIAQGWQCRVSVICSSPYS